MNRGIRIKKNKKNFIFFLSFVFLILNFKLSNSLTILGALNKVSGKISKIKIEDNSETNFGTLKIVVKTCKKSLPEDPPENSAFIQIWDTKIDKNYTKTEKQIIKKAITELSSENEIADKILEKAEKIEDNSNQILNFTREVKNLEDNIKIKIIEVLWNIIYSDNNPDIYENNLMRRLTGLLYLDPKIVSTLVVKTVIFMFLLSAI